MNADDFYFKINQNKNLMFFDTPIKIISIYDHHLFERSEYDSLSPPQREFLEKFLADYEFSKKSGRELYSSSLNLKVVFPKPAILGASPFDILRYEKLKEDTIYVLTPTQCACYFLTLEDFDEAKKLLEELIHKFPINLKKIKDHAQIETQILARFELIYPHLEKLQTESVQRAKDNSRSHIGRIF